MEAPNPTDPSQTLCFAVSERKPAFSTRRGFCIDFGTHSAPFRHHFGVEMGEESTRIASEPASKNNEFFEWFFGRFLDHFDLHFGISFWVPGLQKSCSSPELDILAPQWSFWFHFEAKLTVLDSILCSFGPTWGPRFRIWGTVWETNPRPRKGKTKTNTEPHLHHTLAPASSYGKLHNECSTPKTRTNTDRQASR